jgi:alkanesulfonate monooxygenase SsuD/methylene tetrahydromethanopterin reductase-like flavin-dependent oxidoreductase (luciferase family)
MALLQQLWTRETVELDGKWEQVSGLGINPLPIQRPIPMWIGASAVPSARIRRRIGRLADGWFALCSPEEYPEIRDDIRAEATAAGRDPTAIGTEAGVAVVGPREHEWQSRVTGWRDAGLSHLCLRTLGGDIPADQHIPRMRQAVAEMP